MRVDIDDPDLSLAEIFLIWPATARVFLAHRTACVGCPMARFHTVGDTCVEYRLDEPAFRAELRAAAVEPSPRRRSGPRAGAGQ